MNVTERQKIQMSEQDFNKAPLEYSYMYDVTEMP